MPASTQQLELLAEFQLGVPKLSRVIAAWDLLPLFCFGGRVTVAPETTIAKIPSVCKEYEHRGERFRLRIAPAVLELACSSEPQGQSRIVFPGEREQLVAMSLRALVVEKRAAVEVTTIGESAVVKVVFRAGDVRSVLCCYGHTFSHAEVMDSFRVMAHASVDFEHIVPGRAPRRMVVRYFHQFCEDGGRLYVELNRFESERLLSGEFRAYDHSAWMQLRDPLARWLFLFLQIENRGAAKPDPWGKSNGFRFDLGMLTQRGLISSAMRIRQAVPRVRRALELLGKRGFLHRSNTCVGFDEEIQRQSSGPGRPRIVAASWVVYLSSRAVDQLIDAHEEAKPRKPELCYLSAEERRIRTAKVLSRIGSWAA